MLTRTEPACLVIADISGYSGYLIGVELDHAQIRGGMERSAATLVPLLKADAAERIARQADEPEVPPGAARHVREPVRRSTASPSERPPEEQEGSGR